MISKKILVTGGAGYIGSQVARELARHGRHPVIFDNLSSGCRENTAGFGFFEGDLTVFEEISRVFQEVEIGAIIHLAGLKAAGESMVNPSKYAWNNLVGAVNLIKAAEQAGVDKIIFSSSAAVYGQPQYLPLKENHPLEPINFYGWTKLKIEELLEWYRRLGKLNYVALRYFNAVGYDLQGEVFCLERKSANLLPVIFETAFGRRPKLEIFGNDYPTSDGSCVRDYVHIADLALAHFKALDYLESVKSSLIVNLGTATGSSVFEIIKKVKEISGIDFSAVVAPRRPGDPAELVADFQKARAVLGWEPKHSDLETIVASMFQSYQKFYSLKK